LSGSLYSLNGRTFSYNVVGNQSSTNVKAKAAGGPVSAGQPYLVGDNPDGSINKTTELFVPNRDGTIINSRDLQKAVGGEQKSTVNHITVILSQNYTSGQFFKDLDNDNILSSKGLVTNRGNI
jgi:hypothetical protein